MLSRPHSKQRCDTWTKKYCSPQAGFVIPGTCCVNKLERRVWSVMMLLGRLSKESEEPGMSSMGLVGESRCCHPEDSMLCFTCSCNLNTLSCQPFYPISFWSGQEHFWLCMLHAHYYSWAGSCGLPIGTIQNLGLGQYQMLSDATQCFPAPIPRPHWWS